MSHLSVCKTKIQNPNKELLKRALEDIARKIGATLRENTTVYGWSGSEHVDFLLQKNGKGGANGFGIKVTPNGIEVIGDEWAFNYKIKLDELSREIEQRYTMYAIMTAAAELGLNISGMTETQEGIVLELTR